MMQKSLIQKAIDLQEHAAEYQFDWKHINPVFDKLYEEIEELQSAIDTDNKNDIAAEFGDILFVMANIARHLNIDPNAALEKTNVKFSNRFNYVLKSLKINQTQHDHSLETMESEWQKSKKHFP